MTGMKERLKRLESNQTTPADGQGHKRIKEVLDAIAERSGDPDVRTSAEEVSALQKMLKHTAIRAVRQ